jgi:hypothetical protein
MRNLAGNGRAVLSCPDGFLMARTISGLRNLKNNLRVPSRPRTAFAVVSNAETVRRNSERLRGRGDGKRLIPMSKNRITHHRTHDRAHGRVFSRRVARPSFAAACLSKREGAGKAGHRLAPMVRVQQKSTRQNHRFSRNTRPSLRNGFNGLLRALPGDRAFLPPSFARLVGLCELSASVGAPGPHGLTVRMRASRLLPHPRPPHPASTFVTTRTPLFDEAGWRYEATDLG